MNGRKALAALTLCLLALQPACERNDVWDTPLEAGAPVALQHVVAWPVVGREEVALFEPESNTVTFQALSAAPRLLRGLPRVNPVGLLTLDAEGGATRLNFDPNGRVSGRADYTLGAAFNAVEVSEDGKFAVFHHGGAFDGAWAGTDAVRNPNEISIVDLTRPPSESNPTRRTLRAFGAGLRGLVISGEGEIGGARRRMAWAFSERYLALFDLARPEAAEVIVHLTLPHETREVFPIAVIPVPALPGGAPGAIVRASGTDDLFSLTFPPDAPANEVPRPALNALAGGTGVTDILPLITPAGLRIFALSSNRLAILNPFTGARKTIELPVAGGHLLPFLGGDGERQALVWQENGTAVAFVRLDEVETDGGRAVDVLTLESPIFGILPVEGRAAAVAVSPARVVILEFDTRSATPFDLGGSLSPAVDGGSGLVLEVKGGHVFALLQANVPTLVSINLDSGESGAVEIDASGTLMLVPGAGRLVVAHDDPFGGASVVPSGGLSLDDTDVVRREALFLTEVLSR